MAITSYVNGAGGSSGADLACLGPLSTSGLIYYVGNSVTGAADGNTGLERGKPWATASHASLTVAAGDTVVFLAGHSELIGSAVTLSGNGISFVGEGSGASVPRFTCTAGIAMFDVTGNDILLDNLYFPASTSAPTARVRLSGNHTKMNALQFECGASDTTKAISIVTGAQSISLYNSTFTSVASGAAVAIEVVNALAGLTMDRVTFNGGSFEWSDYAFKGTAAVTRMRATRIYQLAGSDAILSTGTTGIWQTAVSTGNSRLNWTV